MRTVHLQHLVMNAQLNTFCRNRNITIYMQYGLDQVKLIYVMHLLTPAVQTSCHALQLNYFIVFKSVPVC